MDAQHVGDLPSTVLSFAARHAFVADLALAGNQFASELAHGHDVDAFVNRFG